MMLRHPPRPRLDDWLDGAGDPKLDAHLATCTKCAARLETLATPGPDLRAALSEALAPPADLVPRLHHGVRTRLERRQELGLLAQMLGLPLQTARVLMDDEEQR